jgi:hypothetical protein
VCRFNDVQETPEFFIKPTTQTKAFTGTVCTWPQYTKWRERILQGDSSGYFGLTPATEVLYGPVHQIDREYRFFVVDGKVTTGSLYREDGVYRVIPFFNSPWYRDDVERFVQDRCAEWQPNRTFCLDTAVVQGYNKILEINCINSSGLYECDAVAIVAALEANNVK